MNSSLKEVLNLPGFTLVRIRSIWNRFWVCFYKVNSNMTADIPNKLHISIAPAIPSTAPNMSDGSLFLLLWRNPEYLEQNFKK